MTTTATRPQDARPGDHLTTFERSADFETWNRYAAVNDEFVPIHMDDDAGRRAGLGSAIGMGNLGVAHIHCLLRSWLDDTGRIAAVSLQFRNPALRGRANIARGTVSTVTETGHGRSLELEVWIEDDGGTVLTKGTAAVEVSVGDGGG